MNYFISDFLKQLQIHHFCRQLLHSISYLDCSKIMHWYLSCTNINFGSLEYQKHRNVVGLYHSEKLIHLVLSNFNLLLLYSNAFCHNFNRISRIIFKFFESIVMLFYIKSIGNSILGYWEVLFSGNKICVCFYSLFFFPVLWKYVISFCKSQRFIKLAQY